MKIGMPTLIELDTLEDNVMLCAELGLDFLEINMNFPQYQLDKLDVNELNDLQKRFGIFFTFHLAEDIDIGHLNRNIRNVYVNEVINVLKLMQQVNSRVLNMHMSQGIYVTLPNKKVYIYDKYKSEYLHNITEFMSVVSEHINDSNQSVFIENTGIGDIDYVHESIRMMLKSDNFKLTWDIGHDHSSGLRDRTFLEENIELIEHYHVHDAIGKTNHLTLFDGEIDIEKFITLAKTSKSTVVFETKTVEALRESVKRYRSL